MERGCADRGPSSRLAIGAQTESTASSLRQVVERLARVGLDVAVGPAAAGSAAAGPELTVAGIAEAGQDVAAIVELPVERR